MEPRFGTEKVFVFIRHGKTESNEYEQKYRWATKQFKDPRLWDTHLTDVGVTQAEGVRSKFCESSNPFDGVDVIFSSPLRRALNTAEVIFSEHSEFAVIPRVAVPLATERVYFSADVGRSKQELMVNHPSFNFELLDHESPWWYTPENETWDEWRPYPETSEYACAGGPSSVFSERMQRLKNWLICRPERRIVLVTHWAVIRALTGQKVENCAVVTVSESELLDKFVIDDLS